MSLITIVIPVYNEEENLPIVHERLRQYASGLRHDFEFVFVDDGSSDGSFAILKALAKQDGRVKIVQFSRNFGSHAACFAGLLNARGDACAFLSADLQDPPEMLDEFIGEWERGSEVVIGVREWGAGSSRIFQKIYYRLVRRFALSNMPEGGTDVFLIDRKVVDAVTAMGEKNTSVFGLILWSGFNQTVLQYRKQERQRGVSKWTLGKKIKLFIDTFVSFSYFPIRTISVVGMAFALLGFVYALIVVANRLFRSVPVEGWTSLMVVVLVVSGVQLIMIGMLGEYLWRSFDESRKRPQFIIKDTIGLDDGHIREKV